MADLGVTCSHRDGVAVVSLMGDIDLHSADEAGSALTACVEDTAGDVVADLTGVSFIDSSGLRVLLRTYRGLRARGRRFAMATEDGTVRRVLQLSGLDSTLSVAPTVDAAVAQLA